MLKTSSIARGLAAACVGTCLSLATLAQPASAPAGGADRSFALKAAEGGMAEVALGQLAQQKAGNAQVKEFGAHMVKDHSTTNDELKRIAVSRSIALPAAPSPQHQKDAARLAKLSAGAFDRAYMDQMVADHKKTIALFQGEAKGGKDPELRAFATKTLPALADHLKMAESTRASVRAAPAAAGTRP